MLTLVTAAEQKAVDLSTFMEFASVSVTDYNDTLSILLDGAQDNAERLCRSYFVTQTWAETLSAFSTFALALNPVQSITSITYIDADGDEQTVSSSVYQLITDNQERSYVRLAYGEEWPTPRGGPDDITITYVVGYGTQAQVPGRIRQAIMVDALSVFENREGEVDIQSTIAGLLTQYRYHE